MTCVRFTSIAVKGTIPKRAFETVVLSMLSKAIKRQIREGHKSFLLGPLEDRKVANVVASVIADLKMARIDADFHFLGSHC